MAGGSGHAVCNPADSADLLLNGEKGFTFIELLCSLVLGLLLITGFTALFMMSNTGWREGSAQTEQQQNARFAMDRIADEVRYATLLETNFGETESSTLSFRRPEENNSVVFCLNGTEIVRETKYGSSVVSHQKLALGINQLNFSLAGKMLTISLTAEADGAGEDYNLSTAVYLRNLN